MINLLLDNTYLILEVSDGDLAPRHESQLAYWGFTFHNDQNRFVSPDNMGNELIIKVIDYIERCKFPYTLTPAIKVLLAKHDIAQEALSLALNNGRDLKDAALNIADSKKFISFLRQYVPRQLKEHQLKAALHLLAVRNGANFSVPGSGKTTVVLSVFHQLRKLGEIDSLFVIGPPACFGPWCTEYEQTLGLPPTYEILAGGDIDQRHSKYFVNKDSVSDLYLTSFQTLHHDWKQVRILFERQGVRFFLIVDEAHYIKQLNGAWAKAALNVAEHATRRCILTGTPFPRSYSDAFNLFDVLWPESPPISVKKKHQIELFMQHKEPEQAAEVLDEAVAPLFYRVRKAELGLAPQDFQEPIRIEMNRYERLVYDSILDRIQDVSKSDYFRDLSLLMRLRRGRMIRLRQCISYTALLNSAVAEYSENLLEENLSIADVICNYDDLEIPAKLEVLVTLLTELQQKGEKVVIWSNFVRTLERIHETANKLEYGARLIYGDTPMQNMNVSEEMTREGIIRDFVCRDSGVDVLVANPAACAESISLHKTCSHAIYYDLSYNCAQYLQSLDRIHRVGGSENKIAHYHFLQYEDTIEEDILANVKGKAERMSRIIDQDYSIYSLDMFSEDEELEAYNRLFKR